MPVHMSTRLSTKPINQYQYLQLFHTYAEFIQFQKFIHDPQFQWGSKTYPLEEFYKSIDWVKVTTHWNILVHQQSSSKTNSNKWLYGKLPSHLEHHAKQIVAYRLEHSTILMESNAEALKPFYGILAASNDTLVSLDLEERIIVTDNLKLQNWDLTSSTSIVGTSNDQSQFDYVHNLNTIGPAQDNSIMEVETDQLAPIAESQIGPSPPSQLHQTALSINYPSSSTLIFIIGAASAPGATLNNKSQFQAGIEHLCEC
ncbi:hypothetical protein GYMLUDRAFT_64301 [Collybiopsis luxurians FD-317 M1]|uniref:Uncharacterized protein n=1 Tax=Collybiopsis luxurians FD-317 M1 TaxID=944289 RepID=A0A0D0BRV8_9AGAR|nr:hypothetical protein GYMLUDRAFT_64301 [Collybiopsis luxurians FD-317 M1]